MIWKVIAVVASVGFVGVLGFLIWLLREIGDGFADAFGYPRKRRWRRQ